jgi:hypothetical protein
MISLTTNLLLQIKVMMYPRRRVDMLRLSHRLKVRTEMKAPQIVQRQLKSLLKKARNKRQIPMPINLNKLMSSSSMKRKKRRVTAMKSHLLRNPRLSRRSNI